MLFLKRGGENSLAPVYASCGVVPVQAGKVYWSKDDQMTSLTEMNLFEVTLDIKDQIARAADKKKLAES